MDKAERESAKFRKKIEKDMRAAGKHIAEGFRLASVAAVGAAAGMVLIIKKQMDLIDQTSKTALALNTSYASMENVKRAAELSGVGIEQLDNAMKKLADNIGEAISGSKTQAEVFGRLGISAKDLYSIPIDERINKINKALRDNIPIAERAAVAADLYGAKNALFMQQIDSGTIEEAARQVKIFGTALSDVDAVKVEMAGDSISNISTAIDGLDKAITVELSGLLRQIGEDFLVIVSNGGGMKSIAEDIVGSVVPALGMLADSADFVKTSFSIVQEAVAGSMLSFKEDMLELELLNLKYARYNLRFKKDSDSYRNIESAIADKEREIGLISGMLSESDSKLNESLDRPYNSASDRLFEYIERAQASAEVLAAAEDKRRKLEAVAAAAAAAAEKKRLAAAAAAAAAKERADSEQKYLDEVTKAQIAAWNERMDKEREAIEEVRKMMLTEEQVIKESYQKRKDAVLEAITLSADEKRELVVALQKKEDEELAKLSDEKRKKELDAQMTTLDNYENLFSSLHDLSAAFGKENSKTARAMFGIAKAAAVAKAMLAISGAAQAMGDTAVTTEQRIAHAATIASAVAGIVSTVKGVKMDGMAHDGIDAVPKTGTWLLEKGERVMTAETSAKLDNKLDGMGGRTKIVNVIDPRMVADYLSTDAGEEIVMNIIGRNQAAVAAYARG
jgi:hypothetical protein